MHARRAEEYKGSSATSCNDKHVDNTYIKDTHTYPFSMSTGMIRVLNKSKNESSLCDPAGVAVMSNRAT